MSNITGISGLDGTVIDDVTGNGPGLMPDIYEYDDNMDNILFGAVVSLITISYYL